jgi:hypothetical protein
MYRTCTVLRCCSYCSNTLTNATVLYADCDYTAVVLLQNCDLTNLKLQQVAFPFFFSFVTIFMVVILPLMLGTVLDGYAINHNQQVYAYLIHHI